MARTKFRVEVLTPEGEVFNDEVEMVSTRKGSVTSVQAIYVPADDLTDPAPASVFAHLNATTVLSRSISEKGIYPAVDPLDSTSTILKPDIVGQEHFQVANQVREILDGKHDEFPESAFYMKGTIDEVVQAARGAREDEEAQGEGEGEGEREGEGSGATGQSAGGGEESGREEHAEAEES